MGAPTPAMTPPTKRSMADHAERLTEAHPELPRLLAGGWGVIYLVVALLGFHATGFGRPFFDRTGTYFVSVRINAFQNVIHLVLGAAGLVSSRRDAWARRYNRVLFKVCIALVVLGMYSESHPDDNLIAGNGYAMGLHLLSAIGAAW